MRQAIRFEHVKYSKQKHKPIHFAYERRDSRKVSKIALKFIRSMS